MAPARFPNEQNRSISRWRRDDQLRDGARDDPAFEGQVPVFEILNVAGDPVLDVLARLRFARGNRGPGPAR